MDYYVRPLPAGLCAATAAPGFHGSGAGWQPHLPLRPAGAGRWAGGSAQPAGRAQAACGVGKEGGEAVDVRREVPGFLALQE